MMIATLCLAILVQTEVVVSPKGEDSNPGTEGRPMKSLAASVVRARAIRAHRIVVLDGEYHLTQSLELGKEDSGLVIEAKKRSRPLLTGCVTIQLSDCKPCKDTKVLNRIIDPSARGKVLQIDLDKYVPGKLSPARPCGFTTPVSIASNELFADGEPMTVSRWPNRGFAKITKVNEAGNGENDHDSPPRKPRFIADSDRPKQWSKASDVWLYGYWKFDWADESILMDSVNAETGEITLTKPHSYGVEKGAEFFAENLLEELDQPGEYFLDRENKTIDLILNGEPKKLRFSTLENPLINVHGATNISIKNMDFAYSRGDGIAIHDSTNVRVQGCQLYNLGERGASIEGGQECGLEGCNVWNTGEGGITLSGGDRKTLQPAKHYAINCDIHHYQRRTQTYRPAVLIAGVGNVVRHCAMHDAPHSAIIYTGNDHLIELNAFYRNLSKTGDGGVVYTGRDWTARGTEIRLNHFYDNVGMSKWEPAIYFDDLASGLKATGNLIERCHWGFLVGGGRDNVMADNVIVDCKLGFDCDARGLGWAAKSEPTMMERLKAVPYQDEIWRSKYPALVSILDNGPMAPMGNVMQNNFLVRSGKLLDRTEEAYKKTTLYSRNVESDEKGSWKDLPGVPRLPVDQMGLVMDSIRKGLPRTN